MGSNFSGSQFIISEVGVTTYLPHWAAESRRELLVVRCLEEHWLSARTLRECSALDHSACCPNPSIQSPACQDSFACFPDAVSRYLWAGHTRVSAVEREQRGLLPAPLPLPSSVEADSDPAFPTEGASARAPCCLAGAPRGKGRGGLS